MVTCDGPDLRRVADAIFRDWSKCHRSIKTSDLNSPWLGCVCYCDSFKGMLVDNVANFWGEGKE